MSVIMICTTKVASGKMAEYMSLEKKMFGAMKGVEGMPSFRRLMLMSGKDDMQHNVTYLIEFPNFAAMDKFAASATIPEFQALMPQFDAVIEGHYHDVFMETPMP
jgi:quinol monooxygenase YgiN